MAANQTLQDFHWTPQPAGAAVVEDLVRRFRESSAAIDRLGGRMREETGTRLVDWVDHFHLPEDDEAVQSLATAGFVRARRPGGGQLWRHAEGLFPAVVSGAGEARRLFIKVESVDDFLSCHGLQDAITVEGEPRSRVRMACIDPQGDCELWNIERHGSDAFEPIPLLAGEADAVNRHAAAFLHRQRDFADDEAGFDHAANLIAAAVAELDVHRACDLFFAAERDYWQGRNTAAQTQYRRQQKLGLGWANHDHHTYRSSRRHFARLIEVFEQLGFTCRERFYAGEEAGWGAQVLEQPTAGIVIFADVDLSPGELTGDFAHSPLPPRSELGTVGLWCKLHGEAFLQAGMHHLECQFDFAAACRQLAEEGVETMAPFTNFSYLRQAFTRGEMWPVAKERIDAALREGCITREQAEEFGRQGAVGSHLEILERNDGYKGFNQTGVSDIIRRTDPRGAPAQSR